eukprot:COSAG02_NODE_61188_length_269_cov_0.611765_1_plen_57_part_10
MTELRKYETGLYLKPSCFVAVVVMGILAVSMNAKPLDQLHCKTSFVLFILRKLIRLS